MKWGLTFAVLTLFMSGCTHREIYDAIQENRRAGCTQRPPSQEEDCLRQYQDSYDEYTEKRNEAP